MILAEYRRAVGDLLGSSFDALTWSPEIIDAALRQVLREYDETCPPVERDLAVVDTGYELVLSDLLGFYRLAGVAYPWWDGAHWHERAMEWALADTGIVRLGEAVTAGDKVRLRFWQRHMIQDLDGAPTTLVAGSDEGLLVTGAAAWAALIRLRQLSEEPGAPGQIPDELKRFEDRCRREWNVGLDIVSRQMATAGSRPVWRSIGL
jgi:hypothetical protein